MKRIKRIGISFIAVCLIMAGIGLPTNDRVHAASSRIYETKYDTGYESYQLETADFNGDGHLDIISLNRVSDKLTILLGNGDGTFAAPYDVSVSHIVSGMAVGDFNNDQNIDIAVTHLGGSSFSVYYGNGDGSFTHSTMYTLPKDGEALATVDYNADGYLDLVVKESGSNRVHIYMQNAGNLIQSYSFGGNYDPFMFFPVFADLNNDGYPDLIANTNGINNQLTVELHNGTGTAQSTGDYNFTSGNLRDIAAADFNHDGTLEVVAVSSFANTATLLYGPGDGRFTNIINLTIGSGAYSLAVADFNQDGNHDIIVSNSNDNSLSMLYGDGNLTFQSSTYSSNLIEKPSAMVSGDFNHDGYPELAVAVSPAAAANGIVILNYASADPSLSTIQADAATVAANGSEQAEITVTLKDTQNNPVSGYPIQLSQGAGSSTISPVSAATDANGQAVFTVSSTKAETVTYTVIHANSGNAAVVQTVDVTFTPFTSAANSTIAADKLQVVADGVSEAEVTVTLKDYDGNAMAGHSVQLEQGTGSSSISPVNAVTNADGQAVFNVSHTMVASVTYTARDTTHNIQIAGTSVVQFTTDDVHDGSSTVQADTASVTADGVSAATVTVTLRDRNNHPIAAHNVALLQDSGSSVIHPAAAATNGSGLAFFTVASTKAEAVTYTVKDLDANVTLSSNVQISFLPGPVSAAGSSVAADKDRLLADGAASAEISVVLKDQFGNAIANSPVSLTQGSGASNISPAVAMTDADGQAAFTVTNTKAEAVTYRAVDGIGSVELDQAVTITYHTAPSSGSGAVLSNCERLNQVKCQSVWVSPAEGKQVSLDQTIWAELPKGATANGTWLTLYQHTGEVSASPDAAEMVAASPLYEVRFGDSTVKLLLPTRIKMKPADDLNDSAMKYAIYKYDPLAGWAKIGEQAEDGYFYGTLESASTVAIMGIRKPSFSFQDTAGHWAEDILIEAAALGYISGYSDGTMRPDQSINREEIITIWMRAFKNHTIDLSADFTDQEEISDWAAEAIAYAISENYMNGYPDGSFRPQEKITRAEMAALAVRMLGLPIESGQQTAFADDQDLPKWAKPYIEAAVKHSILQGRDHNQFAPNAFVTRAEAVVTIMRLIEKREK